MIWGCEEAIEMYEQLNSSKSDQPRAKITEIGAIPDCAENIFMRQDIPCYSLLYAPVRAIGRENRQYI